MSSSGAAGLLKVGIQCCLLIAESGDAGSQSITVALHLVQELPSFPKAPLTDSQERALEQS